MNLRYSFAAAAVLLGAVALSSPALAIETIHIPDATASQNSGPPDALFDKSVPTTWQKKSDAQQSNGSTSGFHFSASGGNGYSNNSSTFGENAATPGSEFHQNGQPLYQDPYTPR
jgi:hypothetical protein